MVRRFLNHQLYFFKSEKIVETDHESSFRDLHHSMDRPIYVTLLQIAIAILYELGLDKRASKDPGLILMNDMKGLPQPAKPPTMEERRAWIGCFLMSSR
jgi:hypothetical protein